MTSSFTATDGEAILYGGEVRYGVKEGRMLTALMENAYISDRERREVKF